MEKGFNAMRMGDLLVTIFVLGVSLPLVISFLDEASIQGGAGVLMLGVPIALVIGLLIRALGSSQPITSREWD